MIGEDGEKAEERLLQRFVHCAFPSCKGAAISPKLRFSTTARAHLHAGMWINVLCLNSGYVY